MLWVAPGLHLMDYRVITISFLHCSDYFKFRYIQAEQRARISFLIIWMESRVVPIGWMIDACSWRSHQKSEPSCLKPVWSLMHILCIAFEDANVVAGCWIGRRWSPEVQSVWFSGGWTARDPKSMRSWRRITMQCAKLGICLIDAKKDKQMTKIPQSTRYRKAVVGQKVFPLLESFLL